MTRIRDLDFAYGAALFRGDGGGVAVIRRDRPFDEGSCWARVDVPGAGITAEFLRLDRRSGGSVEGHVVVEDEAGAVSGDADDAPPAPHDSDPRLTVVGTLFEVEDADYARRADATSGAAQREANARIAADAFEVRGSMDGRSWSVRVGPTRHGRTTLECHAEDGELRLIDTTAPRAELERARQEPVTVSATLIVRRPLLGGSRTRTIEVALAPDGR